jgi:dynein assembly factor with WDR repeat domains 1
MEIVCVAFDPQGELVATGSMDHTAKVWDMEKGAEIYSLKGHHAEIVSLSYNTDGDKILTASFDHTAKVLITSTQRNRSGTSGAAKRSIRSKATPPSCRAHSLTLPESTA